MFKIRFAAPAIVGLLAGFTVTTQAATLTEDFSSNPQQNGWRVSGDTNLFHWNATNQNLEVTWDASQSNSYFYLPLNTILTTGDEFNVAFDLRLDDAVGSYELSVGLLNLTSATNTSFVRGTGSDSPNLAEFDYFPDYDSIDASTSDTNSALAATYDTQPLENGVVYHIVLAHAAGSSLLSANVFTNGTLYTALPYAYPNANFSDFRLNALSINSYSTNGDPYPDNLLAHGVVDNFTVTLPAPPVQNFAAVFDASGNWNCTFLSQTNWDYALQRSTNLENWTTVISHIPGTGKPLTVSDSNLPTDHCFYRISADRP